jgi:hypothetical protein
MPELRLEDDDRGGDPGDRPGDRAERNERRVKNAVAALAEHFEVVRVFVSNHHGDSTGSCTWGAGNYFAQYGQVAQWVEENRKGSPWGTD